MMHTLGSALNSMIYEIEQEGSPDFLKNHPGTGLSIIESASWRLAKHWKMKAMIPGSFPEIQAILTKEYQRVQAFCDSPIERDMLAALMSGNWNELSSPFVPVHNVKDKTEPLKSAPIVIIPQFVIGRFRLDFAILCKGEGRPRILGVECDGKDFHDKAADMERDRYLEALGVDVFRASGKSIHREPYELADLVIQAAQLRL